MSTVGHEGSILATCSNVEAALERHSRRLSNFLSQNKKLRSNSLYVFDLFVGDFPAHHGALNYSYELALTSLTKRRFAHCDRKRYV